MRVVWCLVFETAPAEFFLHPMRNVQYELFFKGASDAGIRYPEDRSLGSRRGRGFSVGDKVSCLSMQKQQGLPGVSFGPTPKFSLNFFKQKRRLAWLLL